MNFNCLIARGDKCARMNKVFGIGIIGCGLIGQKRAKALGSGGQLVACADINIGRAEHLAKGSDAKVFDDWQALIALPEVDIVLVATLHDSLAEITLATVEAGKHVLVEKPAARSAAELEPVMAVAKIKMLKCMLALFIGIIVLCVRRRKFFEIDGVRLD